MFLYGTVRCHPIPGRVFFPGSVWTRTVGTRVERVPTSLDTETPIAVRPVWKVDWNVLGE